MFGFFKKLFTSYKLPEGVYSHCTLELEGKFVECSRCHSRVSKSSGVSPRCGWPRWPRTLHHNAPTPIRVTASGRYVNADPQPIGSSLDPTLQVAAMVSLIDSTPSGETQTSTREEFEQASAAAAVLTELGPVVLDERPAPSPAPPPSEEPASRTWEAAPVADVPVAARAWEAAPVWDSPPPAPAPSSSWDSSPAPAPEPAPAPSDN